MSGVVTALIADYDIRMFCEQVDDTALSLASQFIPVTAVSMMNASLFFYMNIR